MKKINFTLVGRVVSVSLEVADNGQMHSYVITERFRPKEMKSNSLDASVQSYTLESEFVSDIKNQIDYINLKGAFAPGYVISALKEACRNHISNCGRLIITDLYTYVDCALHILNAGDDLTMTESNNIFKGYVNKLIVEFNDSIFVPKPFGLVKLSSLQQ